MMSPVALVICHDHQLMKYTRLAPYPIIDFLRRISSLNYFCHCLVYVSCSRTIRSMARTRWFPLPCNNNQLLDCMRPVSQMNSSFRRYPSTKTVQLIIRGKLRIVSLLIYKKILVISTLITHSMKEIDSINTFAQRRSLT